jgi:hypothetical protein
MRHIGSDSSGVTSSGSITPATRPCSGEPRAPPSSGLVTSPGPARRSFLFWFPDDQNYWLGRFIGDQISYTPAGNTSVFGGAEGASLFWTGDFTGSGKTELLFWFPGNGSWWTGHISGTDIAYTLAGNTGPP